MSKKADFYDVLGVSKAATPEEIAKAFKRIVFATHTDKLKDMSENDKKQALEKLQAATDANDVLSNPDKRRMYDQYGHAGLDNMGKISSGGHTSREPSPVRMPTFDEAARFFGVNTQGDEGDDDEVSGEKPQPVDASEAARIRAEKRAARRNGESVGVKQYTPPPASATPISRPAAPAPRAPTPVSKPSTSFGGVAEDMRRVGEGLQKAEVPLEALEQFRDNVRDFLAVLDQAVAKAKPSGFDR